MAGDRLGLSAWPAASIQWRGCSSLWRARSSARARRRAVDQRERRTRIDLTGLPDPFPAELAWMAHWQAIDGTRSSVLAMNQLANILRRAARDDHPFPGSMRAGLGHRSGLQGWFYATRWGRLPPAGSRARLRVVFRFARLALLARCHDGPWWALDDWHPRCDPRIPLTAREPQANYGCSPARSPSPGCARRSSGIWAPCWRPARCAGRPSARSGCRVCCASTAGWRPWTAPATSSATRAAAAEQAAAFRRWDADPATATGADPPGARPWWLPV